MLSSFRALGGFTKFALVWNALFFLLELFVVFTTGSVWAVLFALLFGALFVLALVTAREELRIKRELEEFDRAFDQMIGNKKR